MKGINMNIDKYNIFDLMGLSHLSVEQQKSMLIDINEIVWSRFSNEKLPQILTRDQLTRIQSMLDADGSLNEIIEQITNYSPNFPELMIEFSRDFKIQFIKDHFQAKLNDCENQLEINTSATNYKKLLDQREKYIRSIELANGQYWDLLVELHSGS